jgi:mannose-6-phosphate isomerase-like protein (cupin superfamily)
VTRAGLLAAALVAAACGQGPAPVGPGPVGVGPAGTDGATADAAPISDDERLAAIQAAMNALAPLANQCWAAAAVDDFRLAGDLQLEIAPHGDGARVAVVADSAGDPVLASCLATVASAFPWPAVLDGQVVSLPFSFSAPSGQVVIDRRLVTPRTQAGVGVAVLLDERNSGNAAASMLEVTVAADASVALARADRAEVWIVLAGEVTVAGALGSDKPVFARVHDTVLVPAGGYRTLRASGGAATLVLVLAPGGSEGIARGGAVPGERVAPGTRVREARPIEPRVVRASDAAVHRAGGRTATVLVDSVRHKAPVGVTLLELAAGAAMPAHQHDRESELLYVQAGSATMTVGAVTLPVGPTSVVHLGRGTTHAATVDVPVRALQLYLPGGPEQRYASAVGRAP